MAKWFNFECFVIKKKYTGCPKKRCTICFVYISSNNSHKEKKETRCEREIQGDLFHVSLEQLTSHQGSHRGMFEVAAIPRGADDGALLHLLRYSGAFDSADGSC